MKSLYKETIKSALNSKLLDLEEEFNSDVIYFYGEIHPFLVKFFRDLIEELKAQRTGKKCLTVFLNTPGGSVETIEKLVSIIRFHYKNIYFVVPDSAMSAGTVFCMSGDKIYMDYSSSLGPIDPQVFNGNEWVPASGYLDKIENLIQKSANNELTDAEFAVLQNQDLALLSSYEQAKNLTVTLIKEWLVRYKFKNWKIHSSTGGPVTKKEKENRAIEVAELLGDNKLWHSHGRLIGINTITNVLKLEIEDYSDNEDLRNKIRTYNDLITEYIGANDLRYFFHSQTYF